MSKTADDWKRILAEAVRIRYLIREAGQALHEWDWADVGEEVRAYLENTLDRADEQVNRLVGECYVDWVHE